MRARGTLGEDCDVGIDSTTLCLRISCTARSAALRASFSFGDVAPTASKDVNGANVGIRHNF